MIVALIRSYGKILTTIENKNREELVMIEKLLQRIYRDNLDLVTEESSSLINLIVDEYNELRTNAVDE